MGIPKQRVLMTYEPRGRGHQKVNGWSYKVDFVYSDDYFKTIKTGVTKGNKFLLTKTYLFVAQVIDQEVQEVMLQVANPYDTIYSFRSVDLQNKKFSEHSYTFLDTSENSVFLNVNNYGRLSKFGNIYISDQSGEKFSLSLKYNVRTETGHSEFDRVSNLNGIYIANAFDSKFIANNIKELEIEQFEEENSMGNGEVNDNEKKKDEDETLIKNLNENIQTYITFNKGGSWHRIKAPEKDSDGKLYDCGDSCYLNLHGTSSNFNPFYSVDSAVGLILGSGSVGEHLSTSQEDLGVYFSRDAGIHWQMVTK